MRRQGYLGPPIFATVRTYEASITDGPELWAPSYLLASQMLGSTDPAYVAWSLGLGDAAREEFKRYEKQMRENHMLPRGASSIPMAIVSNWRGQAGSFYLFTDALVLRGLMYRTPDGKYGFTPEGEAIQAEIRAREGFVEE